MSDHLDRAAEVIAAQMHGLTTPSMCRGIARARQETARERDELRAEVERLRELHHAEDTLDGEAWLPLHRTEAGYPNCSTCDGGGCLDCTDPA